MQQGGGGGGDPAAPCSSWWMSTSAYSTTSSLVMLRITASSVPQYAGPSCSRILLRVSAVFLSYVCIRVFPCQLLHRECRK